MKQTSSQLIAIYDRQMNELSARFVSGIITEEEYNAGMKKLTEDLKENLRSK